MEYEMFTQLQTASEILEREKPLPTQISPASNPCPLDRLTRAAIASLANSEKADRIEAYKTVMAQLNGGNDETPKG
jgi:hypothetical protein